MAEIKNVTSYGLVVPRSNVLLRFALFFLRSLTRLFWLLVIKGQHVTKAFVVGDTTLGEASLEQQSDHGLILLKGVDPNVVTGRLEMGNDKLARTLTWDGAHTVNDLIRQVVASLTAL